MADQATKTSWDASVLKSAVANPDDLATWFDRATEQLLDAATRDKANAAMFAAVADRFRRMSAEIKAFDEAKVAQRINDFLREQSEQKKSIGAPLKAITAQGIEAAQPLGPPSAPVELVSVDSKLPELRQISASDAIFDILRDRGIPEEHQLRNAHRAVFDIDAENVAREEDQICMYMRPIQVWLLRGALGLVLEKKNKKLLEIFETLPDSAQDQLLRIADRFAASASREAVAKAQANEIGTYTPPPLPPVGSGYKTLPLRVRMSADEVIAFTKEVWGPWLRSCHPTLPADAMTRQELLQRDPRLYNRLQALREVDAIGRVFQTRTERLDSVLEMSVLEAAASADHRKMRSIAGRLAMRNHRAKKARSSSTESDTTPSGNPEPV